MSELCLVHKAEMIYYLTLNRKKWLTVVLDLGSQPPLVVKPGHKLKALPMGESGEPGKAGFLRP